MTRTHSTKVKADTAEKIAGKLEDEDMLGAIKCCSRCNRLYAFYASGVDCPGCTEGNLAPLTRYLNADEEE